MLVPLHSGNETCASLLGWHAFFPSCEDASHVALRNQRRPPACNRRWLFFRKLNKLKQVFRARKSDIDYIGVCARGGEALFISNDGEPIPADVRREIFVPFFTTKRSGSGIGLSLSRQMMMMQGMNIVLADTPVSGCHVSFLITKS